MSYDLAIVGGGRMGEALLGGLVRAGQSGSLAVVEVDDGRRSLLAERFPTVAVLAALDAPVRGAVLAVKPAEVRPVCEQLATTGVSRVLSIAAGVSTATIEAGLPAGTAVVRAMPNTPALVGAAASAIAAGSAAGPDDLAWAEAVLGSVGIVVRVAEPLLDAVTGLSGSGPAYVFLVAEALIEGGVLAGLPRDVARALTVQLLVGSARLLAETGDGPEALRAAVTSPGGTTAAGLRALERAAVRAAFLDAVVAATERARELG